MSSASSIDLCFLPATELPARIRRRDISPVEAVQSYLRRIEQRNSAVNAYSWCSQSKP
jgi:amidase/aspartyl-tRNA(Asn)/glutamyl-tRNA(Gln) amidotransferase subunit A